MRIIKDKANNVAVAILSTVLLSAKNKGIHFILALLASGKCIYDNYQHVNKSLDYHRRYVNHEEPAGNNLKIIYGALMGCILLMEMISIMVKALSGNEHEDSSLTITTIIHAICLFVSFIYVFFVDRCFMQPSLIRLRHRIQGQVTFFNAPGQGNDLAQRRRNIHVLTNDFHDLHTGGGTGRLSILHNTQLEFP